MLELMFVLEVWLVKKVHRITLLHDLGDTIGFLPKDFISIQVKNDLMVTHSLGIDKCNKICNKLFPWIWRSLGLLVSHIDLLLGPSTAVGIGISHTLIPCNDSDFCVFLSC
jgi:hypothetical protein